MTEALSLDVELRWQAWQTRGAEESRIRGVRMGALALTVAAALSIRLLFQVL